jgi:protein-disulfide isomerase
VELRRKSKVAIKLEPPRVEVDVPAGAATLGSANAPVTIVEFTDYQCPFCQRAQATVDELMIEYGDKVRLVSRDYPLDFHARAKFASRAARCAGDQKKFWEYHQDLLRKPTDYSDEDLQKRAAALKMDVPAFKTCVASDRHDAAIKVDEEAGKRLGVSGTPAFFINGRMINGARPKAQFVSVIEEELTRVASTSR